MLVRIPCPTQHIFKQATASVLASRQSFLVIRLRRISLPMFEVPQARGFKLSIIKCCVVPLLYNACAGHQCFWTSERGRKPGIKIKKGKCGLASAGLPPRSYLDRMAYSSTAVAQGKRAHFRWLCTTALDGAGCFSQQRLTRPTNMD